MANCMADGFGLYRGCLVFKTSHLVSLWETLYSLRPPILSVLNQCLLSLCSECFCKIYGLSRVSLNNHVDMALYSCNKHSANHFINLRGGTSRCRVCFDCDKLHSAYTDLLFLDQIPPVRPFG